ncbi:MAG: 2-isopropylmalate synthase [Phycisphaerae bacterium]|nr:2-isopropylmalate synthase [Phycisphaerae bacterium]
MNKSASKSETSSSAPAADAPAVIRVFDTTLRDGEQSPGASLNSYEKMDIARALEQLGVDIIEAGFPIASPDDFEAVKAIAGEIKSSAVCGLARCLARDIERAGTAVKDAASPRVHVFCATSEIHRKYKLQRAENEIVKMSVEGVQQALQYVKDVEFSPEDASRTEPEFLAQVVHETIKAGARTINIPDTVGYAAPGQFGALIRYLFAHVPNIGDAVISVHCHNDLGLAVANSLAAIEAGARQVECTINGLGERAGNAALEEVVMALRTRRDAFNATTRIRTERLFPISRLVSTLTGIHVQRNKAIVGQNAFAHESGIHQDGMLKHKGTYEIMSPADVGISKSELVLGKHSGRHALRDRLVELGFVLEEAQLVKAFDEFKKLADKKKQVYDEDLEAIAESVLKESPDVWELVALQTTGGTGVMPTATVRIRDAAGNVSQDAATGDGPIDAAYTAIQKLTGLESIRLSEYEIRAITGGRDAQGEVTVQIEESGQKMRGRAFSTDIIEASARAYINAINRLLARREAQKSQASLFAQP